MIDILFNLYKVRYVNLDKLMKNICEPDKISNTNVFINLENILTKMSNKPMEEYLKVKNKDKIFEFISNVVNIVAHYKMYFAKRGINAKVFAYIQYPFKTFQKNRIINPYYRKLYEYRYDGDLNHFMLKELLLSSIEFIELIFEYIPDVYFIKSLDIENSCVPYIIMNEYKSDANFIVSNQQYDIQYVNYDNAFIIQSKQDDSIILSKSNIIDELCRYNNIEKYDNISANQLLFILSILGDKSRNIDNIKGFGIKKIFKILNKAIDVYDINTDINNINILISLLKPEYAEAVLNNFYCIDVKSQYDRLLKTDIYSILSQIIDKYDNESLKKMNDRYFNNHPINLIEITTPVFKRKKSKNVIF